MYTTYHFNSPAEITTDIIDAIKLAFKGKSLTITVEETTVVSIPDWQQKQVFDRLEEIKQDAGKLLSEDQFHERLKQIRK